MKFFDSLRDSHPSPRESLPNVRHHGTPSSPTILEETPIFVAAQRQLADLAQPEKRPPTNVCGYEKGRS
jgi:hypothetical protein